MGKATSYICLLAFTVTFSMNYMLHADELDLQDNISVVDESHHQWINERNGRTGILIVSGAVLSSPCTLKNNEIDLPSWGEAENNKHYEITLLLSGCFNNADYSNDGIILEKIELNNLHEKRLYLNDRLVDNNQIVLREGDNKLTFYFTSALKQLRAGEKADVYKKSESNSTLLLLSYE
ncbi:pilus-assembly fibrillin subunit [Escherichia coli]|nr:pilus-assembly fibrillin subunit [Escherichia coli]